MRTISPEELEVVTSALYSRYGIDFRNYEPNSFRRRVSWAMNRLGVENVYELWKLVLYEDGFVTKFINEITVNLTELFRNPPLWQYIQTEIIEKRYAQQPKIKIWSAGCSTGEEVYSILMLLKEANSWHKTTLWATDINTESLRKAMEGFYEYDLLLQYSQNYKEFTRNSQNKLAKYAQISSKGLKFNEDLLQNTTFSQHNLVRNEVFEEFDIIFCRNVMIYFDDILKNKVLQKLYNALKDDGFLIIGYYDILPPNQNLFQVHKSEYKIYTKQLAAIT
ncbi:MAG: protein-glutamate O-methyltransferase CheR [Microscillaceae bacterium]|nr:protein-glutamate O-methyltransferase CheR [Microscillaceae bacterium]MDW8460883.1 protein-glutamate O-methyltransferase CheR [Cytophagales bacterium]